jgi:integrase
VKAAATAKIQADAKRTGAQQTHHVPLRATNGVSGTSNSTRMMISSPDDAPLLALGCGNMTEPAPAAVVDVDASERLTRLVADTVASPHSKRAYSKALTEFFGWAQGKGSLSKALVSAYKSWLEQKGLAPATINLRLAAVRKLAEEASDNGLLPGDIAAAIGRVKGAKRLGVRVGNWLDLRQTGKLLALPDPGTLKGKRDRALLAMLVGCGLRRGEVVGLTVQHIQQRESRWAVVDLIGKHGRIRTVPMPAWAKAALDEWTAAAAIAEGPLFRAVSKGETIRSDAAMTAQALYYIVAGYAAVLGVPLGPHDLRRTFGKLAHKGGSPLEQIQLSYGHASLTTTERYLGVTMDFADAPCDRLGLEPRLARKRNEGGHSLPSEGS